MALLHAFFNNLPQEWLDKTHLLVNHLRPIKSVAVLRIAFRIVGPLLPRLANAHNLFSKVKLSTFRIYPSESLKKVLMLVIWVHKILSERVFL